MESLTSFEDFHRQRAKHALHYARAILGSDAAEDVCQEAWFKAWRAWGTADPAKLDPWLIAIVRNCCFERLRATKPVSTLDEQDLAPVPPADEVVVAALELAAAWVLLQRLSPPLREVLWLREVMDLSYEEIARVQQVPKGTVMFASPHGPQEGRPPARGAQPVITRHPDKLAIATWFDGEGSESVGGHVARCSRCRRYAADLARVRSWLRAQPFVAMTDDVDEPTKSRHRGRPVMVAALLLFAYLVAPDPDGSNLDRSSRGTIGALSEADTGSSAPAASTVEEPSPSADASDPGATSAAPPVVSGRAAGAAGDQESALGVARRTSQSAPLKLGLVIPMSGPLAREGVEVREVVQRRVQAANNSGGVAGVPVELIVAAAEDRAAIDAMAGTVDAIVGGFGADIPTATPWIFPADPLVTGSNVVPAEAPARVVGAQLAEDLRDQLPFNLVGVVVGSGPDAALAAGLASKTRITTVTAKKNTSCLTEIATLRRSGAMTLAVAGDSDLAVSCIRAASRTPWHPRVGPLVPPSAAYAGIGSLAEGTGARTVLALPWPTSSAPGAARFRATTVSQSYRALVSYAATELAIDVARQTGTVSLASMAEQAWHSDLVEVDGVTNRVGSITSALFGAWIALP